MGKRDESRKRKQKPAVIEPKLARHNKGIEPQKRIPDDSAEPTPTLKPELIEDVLVYLAPFVEFNDGINGLYRLRLVSKHWNSAITRLLSNTRYHYLYLRDGRLTEFMQSNSNDESISRIAFKRLQISFNRNSDALEIMRLSLIPDRHWTNVLTELILGDFNVSECNEMMKRIILSLPQLQTLSLTTSSDAGNLNLAHAFPPHPRPESYWSESNLATNNIQNQSLKQFSLDSDSYYAFVDCEQITFFDWNFIRACPNLESLDISFSKLLRPGQVLQSVLAELIKLPPLKLNNLNITKGPSWAVDPLTIVSMQAFAECVNHFQPVTLRYAFEGSIVLREFIQKISDSCARVQEFYLTLTSTRNDDAQEDLDLLQLLCATVIHPRFQNLKILHLMLKVPTILVNCNEGSEIPVMENVHELVLRLGLGSNCNIRLPTLYNIIIPHCFPNLQTFHGDVKVFEDIKEVLVPLSKLKNFWKVYIRVMYIWEFPRNYTDYFQVIQGLLQLPMLTSLELADCYRTSHTNGYRFIPEADVIYNFIAKQLPKLQVLRLPPRNPNRIVRR